MQNLSLTIVCATIDSPEKINKLISSIDNSLIFSPTFDVTLKIIHQNNQPITSRLYKTSFLRIDYILSHRLGLAFNRNIGLNDICADLTMVIDSDCELPLFFFRELTEHLQLYSFDTLVFPIFDPCTKTDALRSWPKKSFKFGQFRTWQLCTSVNCLWKTNLVRYDENFGINSLYGSCEDIDFHLRVGNYKIYTPSLSIYHPSQNSTLLPDSKVSSYSYGFGALCRKHAYPYGLIYLFSTLFVKTILFLLHRISFQQLRIYIAFRINGFFSYRRT